MEGSNDNINVFSFFPKLHVIYLNMFREQVLLTFFTLLIMRLIYAILFDLVCTVKYLRYAIAHQKCTIT